MPDPAFLAMRADLVDRGLLTGEFRLTPAGHAHVDALVAELATAEAPCAPDAPRVVWRIDLGATAQRAGRASGTSRRRAA